MNEKRQFSYRPYFNLCDHLEPFRNFAENVNTELFDGAKILVVTKISTL